ncbi:hypothetical protein EV183_003741 [Coemansia sp. RSA 2336]|nr:hypothetical protein EV183_003741 [Coemansia sp. RSA 2336]
MFRSVGKEFLCKVRYQNPLPSVPFPPKLLPIPPTYVDPSVGSYSQARLQHYVQYRHSTLEEATPYPLMVDADYGMPIDPCLLGAFDDKPMAPQELDPEDEFLLHLPTTDARETDQGADAGTPNIRKAARTPGLKRTSSGAKRAFDHSLQGQLQAIEGSFKYFDKFASEQELLQSLKHPTNSQLRAVESIPLFPDETLWPSNYALFSMDTCPDPDYAKALQPDEYRGEKARESMLFLSQAGTNNLGEDETWCEVFLPETNEIAEHVSAQLRESAVDDTEHRLKIACEYDAQNDPIKQKHLMLTIGEGDDGSKVAKYVQFKGRILLKRSKVPRSSRNYNTVDEFKELTNIALQLRDLTEAERLVRAQRLQELQAPDLQPDSDSSP